MGSSDDEWQNPPVFPGGRRPGAGGSGENAMLAARRRAMQERREADSSQRGGLASGPVVQPSGKAVESLPWDDSSDSVKQQPQRPQMQVQVPPPQAASAVTEEMLETLRRDLEAKKKVLSAAKEKEEALREQWRAQKAQRMAQIAQLDEKIRRQQDAVEDVKAVAERELRDAEAAQQQRLREEKERMEMEIREQYEPLIAEQRAQLKELQAKETKLQAELNAGDNAKDLVNRCISSALATILQRVEGMFAEDTSTMNEWENDVQRLVRNEVRSSFAVANDTEAQREREEYQRYFEDTLDFWRRAEAEQRERVLKMDEQLLLDLQSMVHDDLDRLQREEFNMEELYVQSRETWAEQHQQLLQRELNAAMSRRAAEFEEQRAARHELHLERMKVAEERHHETVQKLRWFHEKQMTLLREQYAKEQRLEEQRMMLASAAQEDVARATEEFGHVADAVEGLLQLLKDYRQSVDEGRASIDEERRRTLEAREATLNALQDIVSKQTVATNDEYTSLSTTLNKLETVRAMVEQHLEDERIWLGKQEASFARSKAEWEREYRRWKQMVEMEKSQVLERYNGVLSELHQVATLLSEEERDVQTEQTSISSWLRHVSEEAGAEVRQLQKREEDLKERQIKMQALGDEVQTKGFQLNEQWEKLRLERQQLVNEENVLREDEAKLRQTSHYLRMLQAQIEGTKIESVAAKDRVRSLQCELLASRTAIDQMRQPKKCDFRHRAEPIEVPIRRQAQNIENDSTRLPLRVLNELRELLDTEETCRDQGPVVTFSTNSKLQKVSHEAFSPPPREEGGNTQNRSRHREERRSRTDKRKTKYTDPADISRDTFSQTCNSSNNFTTLIGFSDSEALHESATQSP
ncbi:hypothetical protein, conserved [Trypanosoma brucei brucei TREU927]|uniref:Uncharacterized protein n=1 Tax=Trypanosoma brucei brucei (strain 927/4 GUTat10.1) TaxID=185431 RepID=Q38DH4_TRYB2|nr:hypothetical protein, conserved [Trypanosoma brucei brucei TREU927]EAN77146.1 hypothetical protein, conserved [Trypanosoma brucei brucei TREU927]